MLHGGVSEVSGRPEPTPGMFLANPEREALEVFAEVTAPPPPIDYKAWAVEHVRFGSESPFPGDYDPDRFPFFGPVLDALAPEDPARNVTLMKSAQIGGTVLAQIFAGGSLDLDPGPFLYVHPTEPNAIRWSKQKWKPFARSALRGLMKSTASRDGGNSTLYQERRDERGFIQVDDHFKANSEASLSMMSTPRQVQDDLAKWEMNAAGDPEGQADSRSKRFIDAKVLKLGTPLVEPGCRVTRSFKAGTQEHLHVPCPHCGHEQPLEWDNMLAALDEAHPERAHFTCVACDEAIEEKHRDTIVRHGDFVAHNPGPRDRSFYIWSAYAPGESWESIARGWLKAKGDPAAEQTFLNDTIGVAYKTDGEAPPWEELRDRADAEGHRRGTIPAGGLILAMGVDVQGDWLAWHVMAFGRDLRRWTVDYGVIDSFVATDDARKELDKLVKEKSWPDAFGRRRKLELTAIDGNAYTEDVWDWARKHPQSKVIMVRGANSDSAPIFARVQRERGKDGKVKRYVRRFFNVGVSPLKVALYKSLQVVDRLARGFVGHPQGMGDEFYRELCAERRQPVRNRNTGFISYRWVKESGQRNEVLDTTLQAEAAAVRLGWRRNTDEDWARLEAMHEKPGKAAADEQGQLDLEEHAVAAAEAEPEGQAEESGEESRDDKRRARRLARLRRMNGSAG